jgi:hypothetical protein
VDKRARARRAAFTWRWTAGRFPAHYGIDAKGLAKRFGNPAYEHAGFARSLPASAIGPGRHELSVLVLAHDKKSYYRPNEKLTFETR